MNDISPMGVALRHLCGDRSSGEGPLAVMTRLSDFNVVTVQDPQGNPMSAPANSLVAFTAQSFRELSREGPVEGVEEPCDVWEFRVQTPGRDSAPSTWALMYLSGADIFLVRAPSKVAF